MADRSDEATKSRDAPSTEELLEETDALLSGDTGAGTGVGTETQDAASDDGGSSGRLPAWLSPTRWAPSRGADGEASANGETAATGTSTGWTSRFSPSGYGSLRSLLAVALVLATGLLVGGTVLPVAGRVIGTFVAAFLLGAVASRRRYLEVAVGSVAVGAVGAVLGNVMLAVAGSTRTVVAVGAGTAVASALVGYYFGRDLRNGLTRDV